MCKAQLASPASSKTSRVGGASVLPKGRDSFKFSIIWNAKLEKVQKNEFPSFKTIDDQARPAPPPAKKTAKEKNQQHMRFPTVPTR